MLIFIGTMKGDPVTGWPVEASVALITTDVLTVAPPANPAVLTITLMEVVLPPPKFVPEVVGKVT
jgi:hypothetical protein